LIGQREDVKGTRRRRRQRRKRRKRRKRKRRKRGKTHLIRSHAAPDSHASTSNKFSFPSFPSKRSVAISRSVEFVFFLLAAPPSFSFCSFGEGRFLPAAGSGEDDAGAAIGGEC
jgi:hypothetical protein